ncbi:FAD-binding oxidoreductase [Nonomuraea sp. LPB2021202275-12-8]|uniref:FAD-binding oxidoreductase n=1 Tax=Nonomuraea sp. LPB2021202275-12-8 TaxID=3120159 RepID=UPI00300D8938
MELTRQERERVRDFRRPGLVLLPRTAEEVRAALRLADTQGVPLSVRSGGHGTAGGSTNDGGIIIDLSCLGGIRVLDRDRARPGIGLPIGRSVVVSRTWTRPSRPTLSTTFRPLTSPIATSVTSKWPFGSLWIGGFACEVAACVIGAAVRN